MGELLKKLMLGTGVGVGSIVAYTVFDVAHAKPELVIPLVSQLFTGTNALSMILLLGVYFGNQRFSETLQVMRENTTAQQVLADSVKAIADRDDRVGEEQRRLLTYVGTQMEKILLVMDEVKQDRVRGASA